MIKEYEENEEVLFVNHRIEHRPRIETQIDSDPTLWGHSFTRRRGDLDFDYFDFVMRMTIESPLSK